MKHVLFLASGSASKVELLTRLGHTFDSQSVDVDETPRPYELPQDLSVRLAKDKAIAGFHYVVGKHGEGRRNALYFSIGADQVVALGLDPMSKIFSKPGTREKAIQQLVCLEGTSHYLLCAVALAVGGPTTTDPKVFQALVTYKMTMRSLTLKMIENYVALDLPLSCAGSYKIECAGIRLFSDFEGPDYTAIIGLPLTRVETLLIEAGFRPDRNHNHDSEHFTEYGNFHDPSTTDPLIKSLGALRALQ